MSSETVAQSAERKAAVLDALQRKLQEDVQKRQAQCPPGTTAGMGYECDPNYFTPEESAYLFAKEMQRLKAGMDATLTQAAVRRATPQ